MATTTDRESELSIGPRSLPLPAASEQLRKQLAEAPAVKVSSTVPGTIEEWKAAIAAHNKTSAKVEGGWAEKLGVRVEPDTIAGVRVYRITPPEVAPEHAERLFVHVHGGAFLFNGGIGGTAEGVEIAGMVKIPALTIDYRQPPDHPAPAAMDDIVAVWQEVTKHRAPSTTAMGGSSAGGNLTLTATLRLKARGLELPGALFVGTPAVDLAKHGDTKFLNDGVDRILGTWDGVALKSMEIYAGGKSFEDPYPSPIFGDVSGFPPTYLISGTRDLMLSDTVRIHRKLRQAGVVAELNVYEGFSHADFDIMFGTPESAEHFKELSAFLDRHLK